MRTIILFTEDIDLRSEDIDPETLPSGSFDLKPGTTFTSWKDGEVIFYEIIQLIADWKVSCKHFRPAEPILHLTVRCQRKPTL